ncbi:MAG: hypothetical protein JNK79_10145 [Chitinophagaceae bacterium]|nr:hypothetical protein [Chitinophagaceae bacterium]
MKVSYLPSVICGLLLTAQIGLAQGPASYRGDRVFIINAPIKDAGDFRALAKQAVRLKKYGRVQLNVSTLADKSFHEIPKQGSPWHEYASNNPSPFKFFPDPKLAPFIPTDFVKKNRQMLLEKTKILREAGLEAAFFGYEPNFLPEAFFDAYPRMLGPRVDHPRRSTQKAFAPCIDTKETQEMYAGMMAEMLKNAPEISSFFFKTNDAGAGICWSHWLYTGPNGPSKCKGVAMGDRVHTLLQTFQDGAAKAGKKLDLYLDEASSNFSDAEKDEIQRNLPNNCFFENTPDHKMINVGSMVSSNYPVTGIIDPVSFIRSAASVNDPSVKKVFINFRVSYDRGYERLDATEMVFEMLEYMLNKNQSNETTLSKEEDLKALCTLWAGKNSGDKLYKAFNALSNAYSYKGSVFPRVSSLYWGVTTRHITRPLVIAPERLTAEEEAYFLPFVFNVSKEEARNDYTDVHGSRNTIPPGVVANFVKQMNDAASLFESLDASAPKKEFFSKMGRSVRIHASIIRSSGNFAQAQVIRDRNKEKLGVPAHFPSKEPNFTGDPDFIPFVDVARDELDNTQSLIDLLEEGGLDLVIFSKDPIYEDRFVLGPDLIKQLKKKRKVMLDHWGDIEGYLASPFK